MNKDENAAILRVKMERRKYWWGGVAISVVGAAAIVNGAGFAFFSGPMLIKRRRRVWLRAWVLAS